MTDTADPVKRPFYAAFCHVNLLTLFDLVVGVCPWDASPAGAVAPVGRIAGTLEFVCSPSASLEFTTAVLYLQVVMHTVVAMPSFLRDVADQGLSEEGLSEIVNYMARHPMAGDLMPGTGGARKVRVAGRGKGKSGGYRLISYYGAEDVPVFLLVLFSKSDRSNLSRDECNAIKVELSTVVAEYRASVKRKVRRFG